MKKLLLLTITILTTICASAQFMAITTLNKVDGIKPTPPNATEVYEGDVCPTTETDDSYNITDKIGIGYQVNEKLIVGVTKDGEDAYELLGRYDVSNGLWVTCVYNSYEDSVAETKDRLDLGLGYSYDLWKALYIEPYYIMPLKKNADGKREGSLKLGVSYKF